MRRMWLLVAGALVGCAPLTIEYTQTPCEDVDLDDMGDPEIFFDEQAPDLLVYLDSSTVGVDDVFAPVVEVSDPLFGGYRIAVEEQWEAGASDQQLCWFPGLIIRDAPGASFEVEWLEPGDPVPLARATYDP